MGLRQAVKLKPNSCSKITACSDKPCNANTEHMLWITVNQLNWSSPPILFNTTWVRKGKPLSPLKLARFHNVKTSSSSRMCLFQVTPKYHPQNAQRPTHFSISCYRTWAPAIHPCTTPVGKNLSLALVNGYREMKGKSRRKHMRRYSADCYTLGKWKEILL